MGVDCCATNHDLTEPFILNDSNELKNALDKTIIQVSGTIQKDDYAVPLEYHKGINNVKSIYIQKSKSNARARKECITHREHNNKLENLTKKSSENEKNFEATIIEPKTILNQVKSDIELSDKITKYQKTYTRSIDTITDKNKKTESAQNIHKPSYQEIHPSKNTQSLNKLRCLDEAREIEERKIVEPEQSIEVRKIHSNDFSRMSCSEAGSYNPTQSFYKAPTNFKVEPLHFRIERRKDTLKDKYIIEDTIGKGSFGKVKRIQDRSTGESKALKIVSKKNCQMTDNFADEIEIIKKLVPYY